MHRRDFLEFGGSALAAGAVSTRGAAMEAQDGAAPFTAPPIAKEAGYGGMDFTRGR